MNVFLSWSGPLSKNVAELLKEYLPFALSDVEIFFSETDIQAGKRSLNELAAALEKSDYGICCLTPQTTAVPWILFEAGALTKKQEGQICALLMDGLKPSDLTAPLAQFQHRAFERDQVFRLITDLNGFSPKEKPESVLRKAFDLIWPKLEEGYNQACIEARKSNSPAGEKVTREDRELLEEILEKVRSIELPQQTTNAAATDPARLSASYRSLGITSTILTLPLERVHLIHYVNYRFPLMPVGFDLIIRILKCVDPDQYRTINDIDVCVNRAWNAMSVDSSFSPGRYKSACDYISKAIGFCDLEFRQRYRFGSVSLAAFEEYGNLLLNAPGNEYDIQPD